ncbi:MAG: multiheme c-type cytochrome [Planctomycetota bacterium]
MTLTGEPIRRVQRYVPAVGPKLQKLLFIVLGLFSVLAVNGLYLVIVTVAEHVTNDTFQNYFYQYMFLGHLAVGFGSILPIVTFGIIHMRNAWRRPNRRAVRVGFALFAMSLVLIGSGIVLTRLEGVIEINDPRVRSTAYWAHVLSPFFVAWLFVLHRLAGRRIRWRVGLAWLCVALVFALGMLALHSQDPRKWHVAGNPDGEKYFFPSLARTLSGDFIPAATLMNDAYCAECHADVHASWQASAHRFSSFNNPAYLFAVRETRRVALERDGSLNASRFCAGCHDAVPFFSGAFNDPNYDDVHDPTASAGISCSVCHSITHINSPLGNADFTIDEPIHYPFATSDSRFLRWVNRTLIKAKPGFHKKTFLKPLHRTTEFCGSCHKVHLPPELNHYKWLRGQNHYDTFWLSGVSGFGVGSFYYPPKAEPNCNGCHMPLLPSDDFAARIRDDSGARKTLDHQFPSANTAVPIFGVERGDLNIEAAAAANKAHEDFLKGVVRVDIFGIKTGGEISGTLVAPLRPDVPTLERGANYLLEVVVRTVKMGHPFTQGTVDSNEVWLDVTLKSGARIIGRSGDLNEPDRTVDPWSHFINAFVLDRAGNRINRRNAQDIFVPLYSNQIPPGAADSVHFGFRVPPDLDGPITAEVKLRYRKFDAEYMKLVRDDPAYENTLPILTLATDQVTFPVAGSDAVIPAQPIPEIPLWQRWNDYGIGLLRKMGNGELRQAEHAFMRVEELGRPDGPLNLARVYLRDGRVENEAPAALRRASQFDPPAPEWTVLWLTGQVNRENLDFDGAINAYKQIIAGGFSQAAGRGFDFSRDYNLLNELGSALYARAKTERGETARAARDAFLRESAEWFDKVLSYDPENARAHYNLKQVHLDLGDTERSARHAGLHEKYRTDDNARDVAFAAARRTYPHADKAAEPIVIYDLQRDGAYGLPPTTTTTTSPEKK